MKLLFSFKCFFLNPAHILFLSTLILGALLAASSTSWLTTWFGLELNLFSFIPLIASTSKIYSSESALKYFLIQVLGCALILATAPSMVLLKNLNMISIMSWVVWLNSYRLISVNLAGFYSKDLILEVAFSFPLTLSAIPGMSTSTASAFWQQSTTIFVTWMSFLITHSAAMY